MPQNNPQNDFPKRKSKGQRRALKFSIANRKRTNVANCLRPTPPIEPPTPPKDPKTKE